ncbi:hypothetical protein [Empedobacter sp. UBA7248]|uniref:hypothetical protein n=1 Tax=Empedobacter sp. UBA7248 TaxID=1946448 RepID=UPI0025C2870F|nr:hypothetical protein [Empedobacter sp. UBA7248]
MPITNLNNKHLTPQQLTEIKTALTAIEEALATFTINLTPDERKKYGSINEQNKLIVNKVYDYYNDQPNLAAPDVDWEEFLKDYESRKNMETILARINTLIDKVYNAKILHDFDNYQAALEDYSYTTYKAGSSATGYEQKRSDIKQFFANKGRGTTTVNIPVTE